jgi:hypothetical protein
MAVNAAYGQFQLALHGLHLKCGAAVAQVAIVAAVFKATAVALVHMQLRQLLTHLA